ncbi:MAG: SpoVA/SpoVAEb family sporulation membrane protein [Bacilli bacterium]|nr:SpoVA/SpoVAEb family sporulation membrane protein [Bacilli bacterium]
MNNKEYEEIINKVIPKENITKNILLAFMSGGIMGLTGEVITNIIFKYTEFNQSDAYLITFIIFIIIGSILTGLGVFDKVLSFFKCGLIVPSTGFANTMTSSAMDNRCEGYVKGIGANIFKLTGSIILYGVVFGIFFGYIRSIIL